MQSLPLQAEAKGVNAPCTHWPEGQVGQLRALLSKGGRLWGHGAPCTDRSQACAASATFPASAKAWRGLLLNLLGRGRPLPNQLPRPMRPVTVTGPRSAPRVGGLAPAHLAQ